jgi:hypothetical protein
MQSSDFMDRIDENTYPYQKLPFYKDFEHTLLHFFNRRTKDPLEISKHLIKSYARPIDLS